MQGQWPRSHAVVTQLGECQTEDLEVAGSSPAHRTIQSHSGLIFQCISLDFIQVFQSNLR